MPNICSDAGPLGRTVEHPGPIVAYVMPDNLVIPKWLGDGLLENVWHAEMYRALLDPVYERDLLDILDEVPHPVEPREWGPEDEVRFGS